MEPKLEVRWNIGCRTPSESWDFPRSNGINCGPEKVTFQNESSPYVRPFWLHKKEKFQFVESFQALIMTGWYPLGGSIIYLIFRITNTILYEIFEKTLYEITTLNTRCERPEKGKRTRLWNRNVTNFVISRPIFTIFRPSKLKILRGIQMWHWRIDLNNISLFDWSSLFLSGW